MRVIAMGGAAKQIASFVTRDTLGLGTPDKAHPVQT